MKLSKTGNSSRMKLLILFFKTIQFGQITGELEITVQQQK